MIYIFHREDGFYPLTLGSDLEAIANAHHNPGTFKVEDSESRVVFDIHTEPRMSDESLDACLDLILRASGSSIRNFSMAKTKANMRNALRTAITYAAQAKE